MRRRRTIPSLLAAALALAAPAAAPAATVEVQGSVLRVTAAPGEPNHPIFHYRAEDELVVYNTAYEAPTVVAGAGCTQDGNATVVCPRAGVARAEFDLGDRATSPGFVPDRLTLTAQVPVPVTVRAAAGSRAGIGYIDTRPVQASLDGQPNDGPAGRGDDIGPGVDSVFGGQGSDSLAGNAEANLLVGDFGADMLSGGAGDDEVTAASFNDVGADAVGLERRGADTIECGPGDDKVYADSSDTLRDCERVVRVTEDGFVFEGTDRGERIIADVGPARVNGRGGDDRLGISSQAGGAWLLGGSGDDRLSGHTGGDRLDGGSGNDTIRAVEGDDSIVGGSGRDSVSAGSGADAVHVRDGFTDTIACGPGRDRVNADRRDRVARDCERVSRR